MEQHFEVIGVVKLLQMQQNIQLIHIIVFRIGGLGPIICGLFLYKPIGDSQPYKRARYDLLAASGRLQNAIKYCTKVPQTGTTDKQTKSRVIWPLFNVESSIFTHTSMPTCSTEPPDMTTSATSGRHFSKFKETAEDVASYTALGRILLARRFVCPTIWWASC